MNPAELQSFLAKWQTILRLRDWDIEIKFGRAWEMGEDRGGEVTRINAKETALITILDPCDWRPDKIVPQDIEYTVVHELVHLHFAIIDDFEGANDTLYEQAVHRIATVLLSLDRRQSGANPTT